MHNTTIKVSIIIVLIIFVYLIAKGNKDFWDFLNAVVIVKSLSNKKNFNVGMLSHHCVGVLIVK